MTRVPRPAPAALRPAGPYDTEAQARAVVRYVYAAPPGTGQWQALNHRQVCEALSAAGVEVGAYDHRIIAWLAGFEPQTVAVIAGLIRRAHAASRSRCQRCGGEAPEGNDLCAPCEQAEGATALAVLRSAADDRK